MALLRDIIYYDEDDVLEGGEEYPLRDQGFSRAR
jgi:hypothetical protein